MNTIISGCSVTNKLSSGSYNYFLYSRIDNYAVILRQKTDDTEYLFRVILQDEDVDTVFASATTETYQRPDQMDVQIKKYVLGKHRNFKSALGKDVERW